MLIVEYTAWGDTEEEALISLEEDLALISDTYYISSKKVEKEQGKIAKWTFTIVEGHQPQSYYVPAPAVPRIDASPLPAHMEQLKKDLGI